MKRRRLSLGYILYVEQARETGQQFRQDLHLGLDNVATHTTGSHVMHIAFLVAGCGCVALASAAARAGGARSLHTDASLPFIYIEAPDNSTARLRPLAGSTTPMRVRARACNLPAALLEGGRAEMCFNFGYPHDDALIRGVPWRYCAVIDGAEYSPFDDSGRVMLENDPVFGATHVLSSTLSIPPEHARVRALRVRASVELRAHGARRARTTLTSDETIVALVSRACTAAGSGKEWWSPGASYAGSPIVAHARASVAAAAREAGRFEATAPAAMRLGGMTGAFTRALLRRLVEKFPTDGAVRYLEIGLYQGASFCVVCAAASERAGGIRGAAAPGPTVRAVGVDHWGEFGKRDVFWRNFDACAKPAIAAGALEASVFDEDCWSFAARSRAAAEAAAADAGATCAAERDACASSSAAEGGDDGPAGPRAFDVYFFDGPHHASDHVRALVDFAPLLASAPAAVVVVDDFDLAAVRKGTAAGLRAAGLRLLYSYVDTYIEDPYSALDNDAVGVFVVERDVRDDESGANATAADDTPAEPASFFWESQVSLAKCDT